MNPISIHCNHVSQLDRFLSLGIRYGEFYNLAPEQLPTIKRFITEHGITASVHCPLRKAPWFPYPVTWSFLTNDGESERRSMSLRMIEEALLDATDIGASYMVVHYPNPTSPGILDKTPEVDHLAREGAHLLDYWSAKHNIPVHIEGFGPSPLLNTEFLCSVLTESSHLSYCFDTGHTLLAARRGELDYFDFLERLAPRIGSVHVWNTRGPEDYERHHHLPIHPALKPEDGWVDIERVVKTIAGANPCAVFVLEYVQGFAPEWGLDHHEGIGWFRDVVAAAASPSTCGKNVVLTGFMGTGKTRVGREVARRLGREFVDMDVVLEERSGMSIAEIFRQQGEDHFRAVEAALCREMAGQRDLVIATGGGALVSEDNRLAFSTGSLIICLQATPAEILRRLDGTDDRPMLEGGASREERVTALLAARQPAYGVIPYQVDTTLLSVSQVADIVLDLYRQEGNRGRRDCEGGA